MAQESGKTGETYAAAGVDIDAAARAKELIARQARSTLRPEVLSDLGFFGGLFEFKGYQQPVLVSSVDGVGTKLKIASALGQHKSIGLDLVNHCVNDILTSGAEPLFFLDYIAMGKLIPEQASDIVQGLAQACREVGCVLIGGETAEMPGMYAEGDYDLAGFIVGVVEKEKIIMGSRVAAGDAVIGLPSSGLHTNGYSLVRKLFSTDELKQYYNELGRTLGDELLEPHRCYYNQLKPLLSFIKGIAHITGGGLLGNVPRVLPRGLSAVFHSEAWTVPPVFQLIKQRGNIARDEMYHVFNMGLGMVLICSPEEVSRITRELPEALVVGEVVAQTDGSRVTIN